MFTKSLTAVALLAAKASATIYYAGVAESGGEFGVYSALKCVHFADELLLTRSRRHGGAWIWSSRRIWR